MATFAYKAVSAAGEIAEGRLEAPDRSAAVARLHELGLFPIRAEEQANAVPRRAGRATGRRLGDGELALATRGLSMLLSAGVSVDRALAVMVDLAEGRRLRDTLARAGERIKGGATLADALAAEGSAFPGYYLGMVRAGEAGGALDAVLARLADLIERRRAAAQALRSALLYPVVVLAMAGLTLIVLLVFVLPEFRAMFEDAGQAVPAAAWIVMRAGEALADWWWAAAGAVATIAVGVRRWRATPQGRRRWDGWLLALPIAGPLLAKAETARFCHTLGTLLAGGVHLLAAVGIARQSVGNTVLRAAIEGAEQDVRRGEALSRALVRGRGLPPLATQLLALGEECGRLEPMLARVAEIYEDEVRRGLARLLALLVPGLTVALGGLVAAIMGALLSAVLGIYQLPY